MNVETWLDTCPWCKTIPEGNPEFVMCVTVGCPIEGHRVLRIIWNRHPAPAIPSDAAGKEQT